ncbi:MAG: efflux RND transporter periplasmic adaptor subunit [Burkholderiales bacterium]|nr:efflux RND transporter periplasmic adaptor subunit [Burkholderiales bacterium]
MNTKTRVIPACIAFAALIFAAGCDSKADDPAKAAAKSADGKPAAAAPAPAAAPAGLPVKAVPVKIGLIEDELSAVGSLLPAESVVIRPEIAGRVVDLHFEEGQTVTKGARLVSIDQAEYRARLAASAADATKESQRFQRTKELLNQKFVSQDALDVAKGTMDIAVAKRLQDEVALSKTTLTAPFSGVLGLRQISPGAYVKAGEDIVRLENVSSLKMDFRVPEIYVSKLRPGLTVSVRTDAFPGEVFEGRIYAIEPAVDEKSRTVLARAQVPNAQVKLKPGMFGRVTILLEAKPNAVIIPEQAVWPQGRDAFVYRVVDGKAVLTKIELGVRRPGEVEVRSGLEPDALVITDGQMKMKDGAPVTVLPPPAAPSSAAADAKKGG